MILVFIVIVAVNAAIWVGIKRGISRYIREHESQCHASCTPGSPQSQPKRLAGKPWAEEPRA